MNSGTAWLVAVLGILVLAAVAWWATRMRRR